MWSSGFWRPKPIFVKQGVCDDDELSHDCGNGDFGVFSLCDETVVNTLEIWVEPHGDDGRHVERLPHDGTTTLDEAVGAYPEFRVFGVMLRKEKHHGPTQEARDP